MIILFGIDMYAMMEWEVLVEEIWDFTPKTNILHIVLLFNTNNCYYMSDDYEHSKFSILLISELFALFDMNYATKWISCGVIELIFIVLF